MGARYYDATNGRFTQMDPTGQETNPYTYAQANPCNNVDRTGTMTCGEAIVLGVVAIGGIALAIHSFGGLLALSAASAMSAGSLSAGVNALIGSQLAVFSAAYASGDFVEECL